MKSGVNSGVKQVVFAVFAGLLLAAIVHIAIVLIMPRFAEKDAWGKLSALGPTWQFTKIEPQTVQQVASTDDAVATGAVGEAQSISRDLIPAVDPLFQIAACRFSLAESALRITAFGELPFWSASVFDRYGNNVYSFNDRNAVERRLDLVIVNPVQMAQLRKAPPEFVEQSVVVEANIDEGFVLIRALDPDKSWNRILSNFLSEAKCERFDTASAEVPEGSEPAGDNDAADNGDSSDAATPTN